MIFLIYLLNHREVPGTIINNFVKLHHPHPSFYFCLNNVFLPQHKQNYVLSYNPKMVCKWKDELCIVRICSKTINFKKKWGKRL